MQKIDDASPEGSEPLVRLLNLKNGVREYKVNMGLEIVLMMLRNPTDPIPDPRPLPNPDPEPEPGSDPDVTPPINPEPLPAFQV